MAAARILIVDDQRDISRMLRLALETSGRNYVAVDVPSAEEALLEVRRGPVDLLITDLRLPGISGADLIKRLRNMASRAAMIVISAQVDEITQAECRRLGAVFIAKPLSLDTFLNAVHQALGEQAQQASQAKPPEDQAPEPGIADRLARLRRDLGADAVLLVDLDGKIVVRAGDVTDLDLNLVLSPLMTAFSAALKVSRSLGGLVPANMHFFDGHEYDIYSANVGQQFALVILFDGERGATQMGPVMRYGRQCADDLLNALKQMGVDEPPPVKLAPPPQAAAAPAAKPTVPRREETSAPATPAMPAPARQPEPEPARPPVKAAPLSPDELRAIEAAARQVTPEAAASFWDTAEEAEIGDVRSDTLSWEQAEKLGLLPPKK